MPSLGLRIIITFLLVLSVPGVSFAAGGGIADMRLYECAMTAQPPTIDGLLDDPCWQQAEESDAFTRTLSTEDLPPSVQTHFRILYDERYLYIGIRCDEPHPERIKANITEPDSASVCGDDCIEIFCHPNPDLPDYYQFAANAIGTRYDGRILDASWNGRWKAAAHVGKDAWFLEIAIALDSFPDSRGIWRFNMNREYRSTGKVELHCWSNTFGAFHTPERFGYLVFAGPFGGLRRGLLIQTANYARSTIEKQGLLSSRKREIQHMSAGLPPAVLAPFKGVLADLNRQEQSIAEKYSPRKELTLSEWQALDSALDALNTALAKVYWDLKFHVLFND